MSNANISDKARKIIEERLKKKAAKDKAKANKRIKTMGSRKGGRSQKEGQEVGSLIKEKTKRRNERLIKEALESQYRKNNPTSKVTTQGDKAPTKFLESVIKHLKK